MSREDNHSLRHAQRRIIILLGVPRAWHITEFSMPEA